MVSSSVLQCQEYITASQRTLDQANKFPMDAQKQIGTAYPDTKTLALIGFWRYKSIIS